MKYVFFGTSHIAPMILERLIEGGLPPVVLVTNPDRPAGRKKVMTPPETKQLLKETGQEGKIAILQPENVRDIASELKALAPDIFVVAAYGKIIPKEILAIPRLGTIGAHPSLLPKYRGPSPIQSVLLAGEKETGVSLYMVGVGLDDGPVIAVRKIDIGERDHVALREALANLAADMLLETLPQVVEGNTDPLPQDERDATFTKKFETEDAFIPEADLEKAMNGDAEKVNLAIRKIKALNPEPGTWTIRNGKRIKLLEANIAGGKLVLKAIQREGKTPEVFRGII